MKYYQQFSLEYVLYELPVMLGWALIAWARENDGWLQFAGLERMSPGFVAQEVANLKQQYYEKFPKQ